MYLCIYKLNCFVGVRKHTYRQADTDTYFTHNHARNILAAILMKKKPEENRGF